MYNVHCTYSFECIVDVQDMTKQNWLQFFYNGQISKLSRTKTGLKKEILVVFNSFQEMEKSALSIFDYLRSNS